MAILNLSYCNSALGKNITMNYDTVGEFFYNVVVGATCSTPQPTVIAQYDAGIIVGTLYIVPQNTYPYAKVASLAMLPCEVDISSVTVSDASENTASDGQAVINGTGSGSREYSLNGIIWQLSNTFTGLAPGNYTARVRNTNSRNAFPTPDEYCYDTYNFTIGFTAADCDNLSFETTQVSGPTTGGGSDGTISVLTINAEFPVEYKLDAGAWQDSPTFTGLSAGSYTLYVRYKDYTGCSKNIPITLTDLEGCDIAIDFVRVTHELSQYGNDGIIEIVATSGAGGLEYSKDNGANYQSSGNFYALAPGTYNLKVKDANDCIALRTVVINPYKVTTLEFPIASSLRVVPTAGPTYVSGAKQTFDNRLFKDMRFKDVTPCEYFMKSADTDLLRYQWRSSYEVNNVKVYNYADDSLKATLNPVKATSYLGQSDSFSAQFSNAGSNLTQIFFPTIGLPSIFNIGMSLTISGQATLNGTYSIVDIRPGTGNAAGNIVLIIEKTYTSGTDPLAGTVTVQYDVENYDVWEVSIDMAALTAGRYYLKFDGTDTQLTAYEAQSEPIEVLTDVSELITMRYKNFDTAFQVDYNTGIVNLLRFEGEIVWGEPGGEREDMEDSRRQLILLRENVTRNPILQVENIPPYLAEKLTIAMAHDNWSLDEIYYQKGDKVTIELHHDKGDPFCNLSVKLRQVDFIAENEDDTGDVDGNILGVNEGQVMQLEP